MEYAQLTRPIYNSTGLYKLLHPVILDGRTWIRLEEHQPEQGEHTERREDGKDGKHQPDDLKHLIHDSKHSISESKHSYCQPNDSKHSSLQYLWRRLKNHNIRT